MSTYLFSGLKVLDVATVIAAPAAAMMLADFGADVIKVEPPDGDMARIIRDLPAPEAAADYLWQMDGRNKRGIVLNLKTPEGLEVLHKLVAECDVYITNQPYPVRESLGLTYEDLKPLKPDMIYASLTAYGEVGSERNRKGFDQLAYWARSGLMDLMRSDGCPPVQGLPGMGDHPTAVALYAGIVTALLHRERTGEGGMVHTSLLANGLWSCSAIVQGVLAGGDSAPFRAMRSEPHFVMRPYQCSDGRWLQINMVRSRPLILRMLEVMGAAARLDEERFATPELTFENRVAFGDALQDTFAMRTSGEWLSDFAAADLPVNLVALVEEVLDDAQVHDNGIAAAAPDLGVPHLVHHPVKISSVPQVEPRRPPAYGEHSEEILRELGYTEADITAMREGGVIQTASHAG